MEQSGNKRPNVSGTTGGGKQAATESTPGTPDSSFHASATASSTSRRKFLKHSARRLAYAAPVVLLFKPDEALAGSGGTQITPG